MSKGIVSVNIFGGGMLFDHRLSSYDELKNAIIGDGDYILTNGDEKFDKRGVIL